MWIYEKKLQFPVKITQPDARMAKVIIEQYGGADGELGATLRYLSQKFTMVTPEAKATLNDVATEEFVYYIYHSKNNPFLSIQKKLPFGSLFAVPAMPTRTMKLGGRKQCNDFFRLAAVGFEPTISRL